MSAERTDYIKPQRSDSAPSRLHQERYEPTPVNDANEVLSIMHLDHLMSHHIPLEIIPNLTDLQGIWHPSGFMVYRLNHDAKNLGTLRLHIWPKNIRQREYRGLGPLQGEELWDGDIHDHAWRVASYNITGYQDIMYDVEQVSRPFSDDEVAKRGLYRRFRVSYLESGEDALVTDGTVLRATPRELRDDIMDTDIHMIEPGDFHAPYIPLGRLAATLVMNSHRILPDGPNILVRGTTQPIVGARRPVTLDEAQEAQAQLMALPNIQEVQEKTRALFREEHAVSY